MPIHDKPNRQVDLSSESLRLYLNEVYSENLALLFVTPSLRASFVIYAETRLANLIASCVAGFIVYPSVSIFLPTGDVINFENTYGAPNTNALARMPFSG